MAKGNRIVVDKREKASGIPQLLESLGIKVEPRFLEEGDYIVFPECAVERKEVHDFVNSLFTSRLFEQANRLSEYYSIPVMIIEGNFNTLMKSVPRPRAIWGALASLTLQYGFHLFFTRDIQETVELLCILSKQQEFKKLDRPFVYKKFKKDLSKKTQIQILMALPGIGQKLASRLLKHFGSLRRVFSVSIAELALIEGLGRVKASRIAEMLDLSYESNENHLEQARLTGDLEQ